MFHAMKWALPLFFVLCLSDGCGNATRQDVNHLQRLDASQFDGFVNIAAQHFEKEFGIQPKLFDDVEVRVGSVEEIKETCRQEVFGCNIHHDIVVRSDSNLCQVVVHELGHSAAWYLNGSWDLDHENLAGFFRNDVFRLCREI